MSGVVASIMEVRDMSRAMIASRALPAEGAQ
jgi:hypothetical protein